MFGFLFRYNIGTTLVSLRFWVKLYLARTNS